MTRSESLRHNRRQQIQIKLAVYRSVGARPQYQRGTAVQLKERKVSAAADHSQPKGQAKTKQQKLLVPRQQSQGLLWQFHHPLSAPNHRSRRQRGQQILRLQDKYHFSGLYQLSSKELQRPRTTRTGRREMRQCKELKLVV